MIITKIESQKRQKNRYNIFIDEVYYCSLYGDTISKYSLLVNDETDDSSIEKIKDYDEFIYGKNIAPSFLSYRIRSTKEILRKLNSKKISDSSSKKVIQFLKKINLLNDDEFARLLINSKLNKNPAGKRLLRQKLFEKGVSKETSDKALNSVFIGDEEKSLAVKSLNKYLPRLKETDRILKKKKVFDYLVRRGYGYSIISEIINESKL